MFYLKKNSQEEKSALDFIEECRKEALKATCKRAKCGSVIVKEREILGRGFNSPPGNLDSQARCECEKDDYNKKVTDKTCCIHAEQRAIMEALKNHAEKLASSRLYFIRLSEDGEISFAGQPYCTICSKMVLDTGIKEFVLYHKEGIGVYDTEEYNVLSFDFKGTD